MTFVSSRELNLKLCSSCLARTHFAALRKARRSLRQKTVARISPARYENFKFAPTTSRISARRSKFLIIRQPGKKASVVSETVDGSGVDPVHREDQFREHGHSSTYPGTGR